MEQKGKIVRLNAANPPKRESSLSYYLG